MAVYCEVNEEGIIRFKGRRGIIGASRHAGENLS